MSEKQPENPQAFPYSNQFMQGMTLRDYFAAKFMAARLANPVGRPDITDDDMAKAAYQRADAMLKARGP